MAPVWRQLITLKTNKGENDKRQLAHYHIVLHNNDAHVVLQRGIAGASRSYQAPFVEEKLTV